MAAEFSHLAADGTVEMVDVSAKPKTFRFARASGRILLQPSTITRIQRNEITKGNVLTVAQIAGIQAAKRTAELIPLCHSLPVQHIEIGFQFLDSGIALECSVTTTAETGVEMEALTGVMVAALTIYDMCKAVDQQMSISEIVLAEKRKEER